MKTTENIFITAEADIIIEGQEEKGIRVMIYI